MPTCFFRICLIFAFLSWAGCLGGPKVNPPEFSDERTTGPGSGGVQANGDTTNASMDAGTANPTTEPTDPLVGSGGASGEDDSSKQSDAESMDDDDAGSTHEP